MKRLASLGKRLVTPILSLVLGFAVQAWATNTQLYTVGNYQPAYNLQAATSCTVKANTSGGCSGLATGDCGTFIDFTSNSPVTVTLPNNLNVPGCPITMQQSGTGLVTLSPYTPTALNGPHSFTKSAGANAIFGVRVKSNLSGTNAIYTFFGDGS